MLLLEVRVLNSFSTLFVVQVVVVVAVVVRLPWCRSTRILSWNRGIPLLECVVKQPYYSTNIEAGTIAECVSYTLSRIVVRLQFCSRGNTRNISYFIKNLLEGDFAN